MGSLYGDALVHFLELRETFQYFEQVARVGAGYEPVGDVEDIVCIRQTGPGRRLSNTNRTDYNAIAPAIKVSDTLDIWSLSKRLTLGFFVLYDNSVYRIVSEKDWELESGYYAYTLEKVVGNDGSPETELPVKTGDF